MQQEYQRIKPNIDREWCSSWASVGDDRCFGIGPELEDLQNQHHHSQLNVEQFM